MENVRFTSTTSPALPDEVVKPKSEPNNASTDQKDQSAEPTQSAEISEQEQLPRVPSMGFPARLYKFKRFFLGKKAKPSRLSKKEVEKLAKEAEAERVRAEAEAEAEAEAARRVQVRTESITYLRKLSDKKPHLVVAFIGVKGAAATTTTMVNCTSTTADVTRVLMYGADFNPASGSAGARLGKDFNESMSIREFGDIVDTVHDRKTINAKLRPTEYGVRVLMADDYVLLTTEQFGTKVSKMLNVLDENCDYLFVDTPNDIATAAARAILDKADVLVFTAYTGIRDSLRMMYDSMEKVRQLGMRSKVANSVVVISNVKPDVDVNDYRKYLNRVNLRHEVIQTIGQGDFHGPFMGVPHDPVIAQDAQVELEKYDWETYQAYLDIDIAILEQALKIEQSTISDFEPDSH